MNAPAPTPELAAHLRAIEKGNHRDREWMADERFNEIVFLCDIVISHLTSAREHAWRCEQMKLGEELRHARGGLILVLKTFNVLPPEASEGQA
jgi:hypothetical protein